MIDCRRVPYVIVHVTCLYMSWQTEPKAGPRYELARLNNNPIPAPIAHPLTKHTPPAFIPDGLLRFRAQKYRRKCLVKKLHVSIDSLWCAGVFQLSVAPRFCSDDESDEEGRVC